MVDRPAMRSLVKADQILRQFIDLRLAFRGLANLPRYLSDVMQYRRLLRAAGDNTALQFLPALHERTSHTSFDAHYSYLAYWATREIARNRQVLSGCIHVDVGSQISWLMAIAGIVDVESVDIRPFDTCLDSLKVRAGSVLSMPYTTNSLRSVSCLHVAEHVGLGRYGDPLQANGTVAAMCELARVLAPGGHLYFAVPCGQERICFNAHRVLCPIRIRDLFKSLGLDVVGFAAVDDNKKFLENPVYEEVAACRYACGMFVLRKSLA